jgi:hypothetical protein
LDGRHYRIRLQGKGVEAESQLALNPGDRVIVRVEQVSPRVVLTPVTEKTGMNAVRHALLREALSRQEPLGQLFKALKESLYGLSDRASSAIGQSEITRIREHVDALLLREEMGGQGLRNALGRGGLFLESRIGALLLSRRGIRSGLEELLTQDFKGSLMRLSLRLRDLLEGRDMAPGKRELTELQDAARAYIKLLEAKTVINHLLLLNGKPFHFQIPFAAGEKIGTLDLFYEPFQGGSGGGRRSKDGGLRMVLLMDFPRTGMISADLLLRHRKIDCRFMVETKELYEFVTSRLAGLQQALQRAGFVVGVLRSEWDRQEKICQMQAEEKKFLDRVRLVDLKV